jgi:methyltransferase (TIGR00027 family)
LFVAAARALEAQKADPLAVDPFAEVFCRAAGGPWAAVVDGIAPEHPLNTPEFGDHFVNFQAARTKYFDTYFGAAAAAGVRQIVLLAAGLDSRAYRLDWRPDTTVLELDQPEVLEFKREVLADRGAPPTADRREVAIDLRDDWPGALCENGFDLHESSAWIAEGLLIYLPAAAQEQLFAGIDGLASAGSRVAVEEGRPFDEVAFRAKVEETKGNSDEQSQWWQLIYNEQHEPAASWFSRRGWVAAETPLMEILNEVGRPTQTADVEARAMLESITLVSAVKR